MKPPKTRYLNDCLRAALCSILETERLPSPNANTDAEWDKAFDELQAALVKHGWFLMCYDAETQDPGVTLAEWTSRWACTPCYWIAGVTHEAYGDSAHALVMYGSVLMFDPALPYVDTPPLAELIVVSNFYVVPLDPSRFLYVPPRAKAESAAA